LGLDLVQHSLDLVDLGLPLGERLAQAQRVRLVCETTGLTLHSTFTGLAAYSSNLLLDPDPKKRTAAEAWYGRAIAFSAAAGARATGGHVGAYSVSDWNDGARRRSLEDSLRAALGRLARLARRAGLETFYVENLAAAREPSTMQQVEALLRPGDHDHVPIRLCLDVGHMCTPGTSGMDRNPYSWLRRLGMQAPAVHLQQSDRLGDHHWPFTAAMNRRGRIKAQDVIEALEASGSPAVDLILEVIPPFEADDEGVLKDLEESVDYWKAALRRAGVSAATPPSSSY
jgi:sugar phosphate isomerase/epimerase